MHPIETYYRNKVLKVYKNLGKKYYNVVIESSDDIAKLKDIAKRYEGTQVKRYDNFVAIEFHYERSYVMTHLIIEIIERYFDKPFIISYRSGENMNVILTSKEIKDKEKLLDRTMEQF